MEKFDSLKTGDEVTVSISGPEGTKLYDSTGTGFHSIEAAVNAALANATLDFNPEDCVFEVANKTTGVAHRYRINAHGNLKLIV